MTSRLFHLFLLFLQFLHLFALIRQFLLQFLVSVDQSDRDTCGLPRLDGFAWTGQLETDQDTAVPQGRVYLIPLGKSLD